MSAMQRSITARYAVRPVARFPRPLDRSRSRRLGLRAFGSIVPAPSQPTILRHADIGPLARLRADWRSIAPARPDRRRTGAPRPMTTIRWSGARRTGADRRPSASAAPWRG
jgi:hypothetical protein